MIPLTTHCTTWAECRDAFRQRDLRQALYDEGDHLMAGVIVNLHGEDHLARRRLENRLFRRETFAWFERDVIPDVIERVLADQVVDGRADLLPLARTTMMTLAARIAGIDLDPGSLPHLSALMDRLARASTVVHATGDKAAIVADGDAALAEFDARYLGPSLAARRAVLADVEASRLDEAAVPRDVLTTLIRNQDRLDLPAQTLLREVAYFPWVGSHSTSNAFVHAMHRMLTWLEAHPADRARLTDDALLRQRFVHETLRLQPASPVARRRALAEVRLRSGTVIPAGSDVVIDVTAANRDPAVFGPDADRFDPFRVVPEEAAPWGLSFGHGLHACLGQELAGGLAPEPADPGGSGDHLLGAITVMAGALLARSVRIDPGDPAVQDDSTTRVVFSRYPVRLDPPPP